MSFGSLSKQAVLAMNKGAARDGFAPWPRHGLTAAEMFHTVPDFWYGPNVDPATTPVTFHLVDTTGANVDTLTFGGVGTYTIGPATGARL